MGVIRNFNGMNHSIPDEEWIYILSNGEESEQNDLSNFVSSRRRNNKRPKKSTIKPEPTFAALGVKGKSHKKFRRYANANLLNEFGSVDKTEFEDVSINDFIPSTPSSFSLLIMKAMESNFNLNEFINCTDSEQKVIKDVIKLEISKVDDSNQSNIEELEDYKICFARIAPTIRKQLLKKHVPLGILASIEQRVIDHFRKYPLSIYKTILKCSYQRFLLHACCQYLNLSCRSSTTNGKRLSCVHNKRLYFVEPSKSLSEYLDLNY